MEIIYGGDSSLSSRREDFLRPSSKFTLAKVPLGISLLQKGSLEFRDKVLKAQFSKEFSDLQNTIQGAIDHKDLGYLLKVQIYTDEMGVPDIPGGQLVFPIGIGTEPVGSLAEFLRRPQLMQPTPSGLNNQRFYVWVKEKNAKLVGWTIAPEFRQNLEAAAQQEKTRLDLLGQWALPGDAPKSIQRAQYWNEVGEKYGKFLKSEDRQNKVKELIRDFNNQQSAFTDAYKKFQETEADLARQQQQSATLDKASILIGIVDNAIKLGALTSNNSVVKDDGPPHINMKAAVDYVRITTRNESGDLEQQKVEIHIKAQHLRQLNNTIKSFFEQDNVRIPKAQEPVWP